jgi:2-dehydro-3-deoxyphosphooctonate aldolase (KDO 8-P synthase)
MILIAGPCVIESREHCLSMAHAIKRITDRFDFEEVYFKASYDKANRTSIDSYRGPGAEQGLPILKDVHRETGLLVTSDVHNVHEAYLAAGVLDLIQIPALLSRQTDLLVAAGRSAMAVNLKKGQFSAPWDMVFGVEKLEKAGCKRIYVTERGNCFGYNRLVVDMASFYLMKSRMPKVKVLFDATHSSQFPAAGSGCSAGNREFAPILAKAALAAGADGVFLEVHDDPDHALCDGPNSVRLSELPRIIEELVKVTP